MCHLVGDDFVVPNRKKVGGELLDINYENTYSLNKAELIKEAKVFGFVWMGDGITIHKMPLMNILALNGTTAPMTVSIQDCTKHMEEGGKKDAPYIAELFEVKIMGYGASLCGPICHTHNPILSLFSPTRLHTTSDDDQTRPKHTTQRPNKHHHHGVEAANPSGGLDLTNPCRLRGEWPCAYLFRCCHRRILFDSIN